MNKGGWGPRMKGVMVERPIVYGSIAFSLGSKATEGKTHKWTAHVRGLYNEDISYFVKKVIFILHPSFENPRRTVDKWPFEIHEVGWGEFEICMKVFFQDTTEKPIDLYHPLKLYSSVVPLDQPPPPQNPKKPVVSESYDEIVFNQPHEEFYKILQDNLPSPALTRPNRLLEHFTKFDEQGELNKIIEAQRQVKGNIQALKEKYKGGGGGDIGMMDEAEDSFDNPDGTDL